MAWGRVAGLALVLLAVILQVGPAATLVAALAGAASARLASGDRRRARAPPAPG